MTRKKAADKSTATAQITFKCSEDLKRDLEDLAHLSRRDVSSLLVELASEFVKANKQRISKFRQSAAQPIKLPTFATPLKTAATPIVANISTASEGGEKNAEN